MIAWEDQWCCFCWFGTSYYWVSGSGGFVWLVVRHSLPFNVCSLQRIWCWTCIVDMPQQKLAWFCQPVCYFPNKATHEHQQKQIQSMHRTTGMLDTSSRYICHQDCFVRVLRRQMLNTRARWRTWYETKTGSSAGTRMMDNNIGTFYLVRVGVSREIYIRLFPKQRKEESGLLPRCR